MDTSVLSAGIAWGMPVRPDELGLHLEAFEKSLPALHALRLCHAFGTGPDVHVTKLPVEIRLLLEDFLISSNLRTARIFNDWIKTFEHFEGRCQPLDHLNEHDIDMMDYPFYEELCDECLENDDVFPYCDECEERYNDGLNHAVEDSYFEWRYEECEDQRFKWTSLIKQEPNGNFAKYDELLRKHFGLDAFFANTRKAEGTSAPWTNHANHKWHDLIELQTTICYLTLPRKQMSKRTYPVSQLEAECGAVVDGAASSIVSLPTATQQKKRAKQFQRALRILKLEPYIHPSQLTELINAEEGDDGEDDKEKQSLGGGEEVSCTRSQSNKDAVKMEWPKLVMLVNTTSKW